VFDTAKLIDGHIYQLGDHLDRFLWSSGKAGIQPPMTLEQMTRTILDTAAASNAANGEHRFHAAAACRWHCLGISCACCHLLADHCCIWTRRLCALLAFCWPRWLWFITLGVRVTNLLLHGIQH
jgi:hypothetical protein